jgi:hypothetical protein
MQAMKEEPPLDAVSKDKFLVQSINVSLDAAGRLESAADMVCRSNHIMNDISIVCC